MNLLTFLMFMVDRDFHILNVSDGSHVENGDFASLIDGLAGWLGLGIQRQTNGAMWTPKSEWARFVKRN